MNGSCAAAVTHIPSRDSPPDLRVKYKHSKAAQHNLVFKDDTGKVIFPGDLMPEAVRYTCHQQYWRKGAVKGLSRPETHNKPEGFYVVLRTGMVCPAG